MSARRPTPDKGYLLEGTRCEAVALPPGLYVVATPIGNLGDITIRALRTLAAADLLVCEDTRITSRLTRHYGISTPMLAYHEHNAERQRPRIIGALSEGKVVTLVSDAGTPLVSDPGYRLVEEALAGGHDVVPIPGASAVLAGLAGAGLPTDAFMFVGFLPAKQTARKKRLLQLASIPATLVFFEAPRRTAASLADMTSTLGPTREAAVARELTKMFETFRRGPLGQLATAFADEAPPKGEVTIVVGPPQSDEIRDVDVERAVRDGLSRQSLARTVTEVATATGRPRRAVYQIALALKAASDD